ncbi:hypothetical protein [Pseudomonas sp. ML96]|uniref:hypothetical protein n=1 Tax=Pseudomonas sp. ML96 TaxID=1523503 RepID=UPI00068C851A|nr:hypothetical protein [Pseudomonas sp. ML96]
MSQHDQDLQQEQQLLEHFREHSRGEPSAAVDALIMAAAREELQQPQPSWSQRLHAWLFGAGSRTRWSVAVAGLAVVGIGLNLALHNREQLPSPYDAPAPMASAPAPALQEMAPKLAREAQPQSDELEQRKAEAIEKKAAARQSVAGAMEPNAAFSVSPAATAAPRPMAPAKPQPAPLEAMADSAEASAEVDAAREEARAKAQAQAMAKMKAYTEARAQEKAQTGGALSEELHEDSLAEELGHSSVSEAPPLDVQLHNVLRLREEGMHADADRLLEMLKREFPQKDLDAELKRLQANLEKPDSSH